MKLTEELKQKIDNYFEHISAEELYRISVEKYGFTEDTSFELLNAAFTVSKVDKYSMEGDAGSFPVVGEDSYNYAA